MGDGGNSHNINWNYGLLPQTWEDPSHSNPAVKNAVGDNDPGMCMLLYRLCLGEFETSGFTSCVRDVHLLVSVAILHLGECMRRNPYELCNVMGFKIQAKRVRIRIGLAIICDVLCFPFWFWV